MSRILEKAEALQKRAAEVMDELELIPIWSSVGATVNLVGSAKTGLMIHHRDIDLHIYSDPFRLSDSFRAIARLAEKQGITSIQYANLLEAEDQCVEWHAIYESRPGEEWKLDMIHILPQSPYAGYFEKVARRIVQVLTPETKEAILTIKENLPPEKRVMSSIQIYRAVMANGVRDVDAYMQWMEDHLDDGIVTWMP